MQQEPRWGGEAMPRTVSATEAKIHLGAMIEWAISHREGVIIESRGRPRAVLVDFDEYQSLQQAREASRRQEAWRRLEALAERVSARNRDLAETQAEDIADRFVRETAREMFAAKETGPAGNR